MDGFLNSGHEKRLRAGVHPKIVQTLARHSQSELTMQLYTKLTSQEAVPALDALSKVAPHMHQKTVRASQSASATDRSKGKKEKAANRLKETVYGLID